jgi:uncharacterized membrane protein YfcA
VPGQGTDNEETSGAGVLLMLEIFAGIVLIAFLCEFVDSSLGMGYGTTLTPLLILLGFPVLSIVPAVLFSEFISGVSAGVLHHKAGNVNFKRKSHHLNVALVLTSFSIIGTILAVVIAVSIPKIWLKTYIGLLVFSIGIVILLTRKKNYKFSWKKIMGLGSIASFNKGMSGGGYGPVVVGGQMLSGIDGKNAVAITSLAEGLTCVVGVIVYYLIIGPVDFNLALPLAIGAVVSVPLAVLFTKKIKTEKLRIIIGIVTVVLGASTLLKVFVF